MAMDKKDANMERDDYSWQLKMESKKPKKGE
jgi:hypothetical protein